MDYPTSRTDVQGYAALPNPDLEAEAMKREAYQDHFYDVISGTPCDFWKGNWNEEPTDIFRAVQVACAMPGQTDAQRWQMVMRHLKALADDYARMKAGV